MKLAVSNQMAFQWECASTFLTYERTIASMDSQVGQQVMFERKAFLAFAALIRTFSCVQQQVRVQAVLMGEILPTMRTNVRTFA